MPRYTKASQKQIVTRTNEFSELERASKQKAIERDMQEIMQNVSQIIKDNRHGHDDR